jgi:hydrogenase maturation factor HypF (carbamoyltransferase family)
VKQKDCTLKPPGSFRVFVYHLARSSGLNCFVINSSGGGVFQNIILLHQVTEALHRSGLCPHTNNRVPCNDGWISLGQVFVLRERLNKGVIPGP